MKNKEVNKILVLRTEHIGDYIVSLPALKFLREKYPKAKITLVIGSCNKDLAKAIPYVDEMIIGANPLAKRNLSILDILIIFTFKINSYLRFIKLIRKESYDLVISFSSRRFNKFILPFVRTRKIISGTDFDYVEEKEVKRCLRVVGSSKRYNFFNGIQLKISKEDRDKVNKILRNRKFDKKNIIILHLFTPIESKNWQVEKWVELIKKLSTDKKKVFVLIGTNEESFLLENVRRRLGKTNIINLAGKLNLTQLVFFISKGNLYIGGDSGPMHIANLVMIPSVILFGQTNEKIWGPNDKQGKILKRESIKDIGVEEVLKEIKWKS